MKKNLLFICFFTCIASITYAQNVPNGGFESWTSGEPDSWLTNNIPGTAVFVTQVSPGQSGSSAARGEVMSITTVVIPPTLLSTDNSGNGFPVTQRYSTLSCYYKFNSVGGDVIQVTMLMLDASGNGVGTANAIITASATGFTLLSIPIMYFGINPTECIIDFTLVDPVSGNGHLGSYYIIDDVALTGTVGINEIAGSNLQNMSVQPNPASSEVSVSYSLSQRGDAELSIVDIMGKEVMRKKLDNDIPGNHSTMLDVSGLKEGFYLCRLNTAEGLTVKRMEVRH